MLYYTRQCVSIHICVYFSHIPFFFYHIQFLLISSFSISNVYAFFDLSRYNYDCFYQTISIFVFVTENGHGYYCDLFLYRTISIFVSFTEKRDMDQYPNLLYPYSLHTVTLSHLTDQSNQVCNLAVEFFGLRKALVLDYFLIVLGI